MSSHIDSDTNGARTPSITSAIDIDDADSTPQVEASTNAGLELDSDEDETGPQPPIEMAEAASGAFESEKVELERIDDVGPDPPSVCEPAQVCGIAKKEKKVQAKVSEEEEEPIVASTGGDISSNNIIAEGGRESSHNDREEENACNVNVSTDLSRTNSANINPSSDQGIPELEAYLVEERELVIAEPALPWWKQRRSRLFLGAVIIVVAALAISFGVLLSTDRTVTEIVGVTEIVEVDEMSPSPSSSIAPSSSSAPSSSPTSCVDTIYSTMQKIVLPPDYGIPEVAVDGINMIIVAADRSSVLHIMFYTLNADGEWVKTGEFQEKIIFDKFDWDYSAGISAHTALVGIVDQRDIPREQYIDNGTVLAYHQNDFGFWEETEYPFIHSTTYAEFGQNIDIDGT